MSSEANATASHDSGQRQFKLGALYLPWLLGFLAALLLATAIGGALWQPVHINAFRIPSLLDQLLYPLEDNTWQRLPKINSNLNDVFALDDGQHVWAVGNDGLILYSDDGGRHWQRGKVQLQAQVPAKRASSFDFIASTWAGEPPANLDLQQQVKPPIQRPVSDLKAAIVAKSTSSGGLDSNSPQASPLPTPVPTQPSTLKVEVFDKSLNAVYFADALHCWAVGDSGTILASFDGGHSWQAEASGTELTLRSIHFAAASRQGLAVGDNGIILGSVDGGHSWHQQSSDTDQTLFSVQFSADSRHGWAVGNQGTILASEDGGSSWYPQVSGTEVSLLSIKFAADGRIGWVVGNGGTILASKDGGNSWQPQSSDTTSSLSRVQFAPDNLNGWVVGGDSTILLSKDGGHSWHPQSNGAEHSLASVHFAADALHGWAVGFTGWPSRGGFILYSNDGGQSWFQQSTNQHQSFNDVQFVGKNKYGWAVGDNGTILSSDDGGKSWLTQEIATATGEELRSIYFAEDAHHGWTVAFGGTIFASDDGGHNWKPQTSSTDLLLNSIQFASDNRHGWAVGYPPPRPSHPSQPPHGTIFATEDGGGSWQPQFASIKQYFSTIHFAADARHGWVVGFNGIILASEDGGHNWQQQTSGTKEELNCIQFAIDAIHGWAVGSAGTILASDDGGHTWQPRISGTKESLNSIQFVADAIHGWVVGSGGTILASNDGGKSWLPQQSGTDQNLNSVHFSNDASHGWVVGESGTILTTEDGGKSWLPVPYQRYPAGWVYLVLLFAIGLGFWAYLSVRRRDKSHSPVSGVMNRGLTDQPAGGPEGGADLLGARLLAAGLVRFLSNDKTSPPLTLAITGEWGSGKSSVMNYLFVGLRRIGLKPVMFNAWHHRDEQNVLASIFTNLHKQIIGPWWTLRGLLFRIRLLWKRNVLAKLGLSIALYSLVFCAMYLPTHTGDRQKLQQYAAYLTGIYQPLLLSQTGYESLCPTAKPLASEVKSTTETTLFKPDKAAAIPSSEIKIERIARQESKLDSAKAQFGESQCSKLQSEVVGQPPQDLYACLEGQESKHCFKRPQQLIAAVEAKLSQQLTVEDETKLLAAAEHLHPDFPLSIPPAVLQWLSALVAVLSLLIFKGLVLVGLAPAKLMQGAMTLAGSVPRPGEPVGTRALFEHHFKRVTEVLGRRRLVLFIDDLDRCDPEHCRQVLEITNFLAGAGNLYVVLGIAPRYVLANVALCFERVAVAVDEVDKSNGIDNQHNPGIGESWFARHFLQKLIHIEVPVPTPEAAQVLALLRGERHRGENDAEELRLEKLDSAEQLLDRIGQWLKWGFSALLLVAGIVISASLGGGLWDPWAEQKPLTEQLAKSSVVTPVPSVTPMPSSLPGPPEPTAKPLTSRVAFSEGQESASHWQRLWPLSLLMVVLSVLVWLARQPKILDVPSLSWLQPLAQRLKIWLFGPETSIDSDAFNQALKVWYPVIAQANPIPRNVKSFLNQLRYFASREYPQGCKDRGEAQLVAMAVAYYAFGDDMDKVFALEKHHQGQGWLFTDTVFKQRLQANGMAATVLQAVEAHYTRFGEFPSESERERFKRYYAMISIQRRDPK